MNILLFFTLFGSVFTLQCPTFTPQSDFKIKEFTGFWYEVARIPNDFELDFRCHNTTYTLNANETVTVFLQATTAQGQYASIRGLSTVIDPATLRILFENNVESDISVVRTDYKNYAALYSCRVLPGVDVMFELGYILSRRKKLQPGKLKKAQKALSDIGVDINKFTPTLQNC